MTWGILVPQATPNNSTSREWASRRGRNMIGALRPARNDAERAGGDR